MHSPSHCPLTLLGVPEIQQNINPFFEGCLPPLPVIPQFGNYVASTCIEFIYLHQRSYHCIICFFTKFLLQTPQFLIFTLYYSLKEKAVSNELFG